VSRSFRLASIVVTAIAVAVGASWLLRRPLSEAVVARWFAAEGIPARYRVTALSPDAVTLRDVALGPAAAPDFRADRIDLRLGWSPFRPRVDRMTLIRPVLRAVVGPRGLSLGSLDRLLPARGAPATPLPDIDLTLIHARATLVTPAATVVVTGGGAGRLRGGFAGRFVVGDTLLAAGCTGRVPGALLVVATRRDDIRVVGTGAGARGDCGDRGEIRGIGWRADVRLPPTLDRYTVAFAARSGPARAPGFAAAGLDASVTGASATMTGPIAGTFKLRAVDGRVPPGKAARVTSDGSFRVDPANGDATLAADVVMTRADVTLPLRPLREAGARFAGTLAAPLTATLAARLDAAARSFDATGTIALVRRGGSTTGSIEGMILTAATGARIVQSGRLMLTRNGVGIDGKIALAGGGLPTATLGGRARWQGGAVDGAGTLTMSRWAASGSAIDAIRLALTSTDGVTAAGTMRVSGALGGGIVATGLGLAINARVRHDGRLVFGERCLPVDWSRLARGDARIAAARIIVCPTAGAMLTVAGKRLQGGATIAGTTLRGTISGAAFAVTATPLRLYVSGTTTRPRVLLAPVTLAGGLGARRGGATIAGVFDPAGGTGRGTLTAAALDDPASPVRFGSAAADWRLSGSRIDVANATVRVVDRSAPARFQPMRVVGATASLVDGVVRAQGAAILAASTARLGSFDVRHDIASGRGGARLATGTLTFGPTLQPVDITEGLRGIVANVRGPVTGSGQVDWTTTGVTSSGTLRIDAVALATEALGPVDGISGTVAFDDLLALTTPPGQSLRIARINPGVVVDDGVVVFRLLGPDAAAITRIRWPYAGGTLELAPVTIRAGDVRRDFLLTVDDLDAQQFLQRFEIKNLNVTGRFDGKLPLVFADGHGRIAAGRLVARAGGGLVQYVGEIGTADTGAAARLAFDALRRLRYRDLALDLDGDLDGELVTQVHFSGNNEAATTLAAGPVPVKVTGLPFRFGITVRAPFRALLGTAASFSDVRPLLRAAPAPALVQPK